MADSSTTVIENNLQVTGNVTVDGSISATSEGFTGAQTITATSANALAVGRQGTTAPAFNVSTSTASSATGIGIVAAAAAGGVAVSALSSGTNESLTLDAKGSGTVTINGTATGGITLARAVTLGSTINKVTLTAPATAATLTLIDNTTVTGPAASGTIATLAGTETLSNKTITGVSVGVTGALTAKSATAVPASAGAIAAGAPINLFSGGNAIWITSDAPSFSATKGDLCINTGGSSSSTRLYINNGTTNWVSVTTAS